MNNLEYSSEHINSIGVIGLGLIGGSILKDFKRWAPDIERYGWSTGQEQKVAIREGLIQEVKSIGEVVGKADIIFIATPIHSVASIAEEISSIEITKPQLIVDTASVKKELGRHFLNLTVGGRDFLPTHPMGGSEKSGYEASRIGIFKDKPWLICTDKETAFTYKEDFIKIISSVFSSRVQFVDLDKHDALLSTVSHMVLNVSHFLFEFVYKQHLDALSLAGESLITTTRLASDNPEMLAEIGEANHVEIDNSLREFAQFIIKKTEGLPFDEEYYQTNKDIRDAWLHHRRQQ